MLFQSCRVYNQTYVLKVLCTSDKYALHSKRLTYTTMIEGPQAHYIVTHNFNPCLRINKTHSCHLVFDNRTALERAIIKWSTKENYNSATSIAQHI